VVGGTRERERDRVIAGSEQGAEMERDRVELRLATGFEHDAFASLARIRRKGGHELVGACGNGRQLELA